MSELDRFIPWLIVPVLLIAAFYLLMPWLVYSSQKMNGHPKLVPFDLDKKKLPKRVEKYLRETGDALTGLGFEPQPCIAMPDPLPNVTAITQLWTHPRETSAALVSLIFGMETEPGANLSIFYTEFINRYHDEEFTLIQANNSSERGAFPNLTNELTFRFPQVKDIEQLHRLHRALVERHQPNLRPYVSLFETYEGDVLKYLQGILVEGYRQQEGTGYLFHDAENDQWRPTVKGAYMMTWGLLWPMSAWIRARMRRQAARLLAELGETVEK